MALRSGVAGQWAARALVIALGGLALSLGLVLATQEPALAEGETIRLTLATSRSGPIEGVEVTVKDANGDEVDQGNTDDQGRFEAELPGPGEYTVTINPDDLPEGVTAAAAERTVTVGEGAVGRVAFALSDGSTGGGGLAGRIPQLLVEGLRFGLLIAMCAVGLSLIFGTTGLTNFAHGELVAIGAVAAWFLNVSTGLPLIPATIIAMAVGGSVGWLNDALLWGPLRRRGSGLIAMLVISIGLSLALRYVLNIIFGGRSQPYADYRGQRAVDYGPVSLTDKDLYSIFISLVVLVLVALMLQRTKIGKAMRAVADNRDLAASSGINVDRVIRFVWIVGGALAALGGVFFGLSDEVSWDMGFKLLLLMFAGVTLGGLGTAYGALLGSIVVGVFVQLSTLVIADELKYVGGLLLLIVILVVRPQGILGSRARVG
ncbi:MAG: branched-chain amino acid ABC transporter permease [Actinomycetota bacterium]|nr:branched-chain amino acid ABC transporter permease [Actinomycetota bacterium]